jgi:hypothetical protein
MKHLLKYKATALVAGIVFSFTLSANASFEKNTQAKSSFQTPRENKFKDTFSELNKADTGDNLRGTFDPNGSGKEVGSGVPAGDATGILLGISFLYGIYVSVQKRKITCHLP